MKAEENKTDPKRHVRSLSLGEDRDFRRQISVLHSKSNKMLEVILKPAFWP
jgi:hypothetical protein